MPLAAPAVAESVFPFDDFWNMYDKKTGRKPCERVYKKLPENTRKKIKDNLPNYINSTQDKKFRKNPLTWLRAESWNDEIISGNSGDVATPTMRRQKGF